MLHATVSCARCNFFFSSSNKKHETTPKKTTVHSAHTFVVICTCGFQLFTKRFLVYTVHSCVIFSSIHWQSWRMFSCELSWGLKLQLVFMLLEKKKSRSGVHLSAGCNVREVLRLCRMFHVALIFFFLFVFMTESLLNDGQGDRPQSAVVRGHHSKHSVSSEGTECHYT